MYHHNLQIIYDGKKPKGIRDNSGYLLFFPDIQHYHGQEERYNLELEQQVELADFILGMLKYSDIEEELI